MGTRHKVPESDTLGTYRSYNQTHIAPVCCWTQAGALAGGAAVARGLAEGIGGVFLKPVHGAQTAGVAGFFTGVAQGIAGVAIKPVVGVLDGGMTLLQGVSQQVSTSTVTQHIRPAATFTTIHNSDQKVLQD